MDGFRITDSDQMPLCPYCGEEITELLRKTHGIGEQHTVYFCPNCKKIIGIGAVR